MIKFGVFFILFSMPVLAVEVLMSNGNGVGNGGDVVICDEKVELLDLSEARHKKFTLESDVAENTAHQVKKILFKLKRVDEKLHLQYFKVADTLSERLRFIPNASFRDVPDSYEISIPKDCRLEQVAIQRAEENKNMIHISQDLWKKMDTRSQAALLIHEIIYEHFALLGEKNSIKVRAFNAFLHSQELNKMKRSDYLKFTRELGVKLY